MTDIEPWHMHFDRKGKPITFEEWVRLFEDKSYQLVEQTHVNRKITVSTVWLGINYSFGRTEPLIFELAVIRYGLAGQVEFDIRERSTTEAEAMARHDECVDQLRDEGNRPHHALMMVWHLGGRLHRACVCWSCRHWYEGDLVWRRIKRDRRRARKRRQGWA